MFVPEQAVAPQPVDGPMFGGGHEPGRRIVRKPLSRPLLQRGHQRILAQLLGHAHIARETGQGGHQSGGLDPPDGFDGAVDVGRSHTF
jgi:hypothetical protein